jgi:hypothetical protein
MVDYEQLFGKPPRAYRLCMNCKVYETCEKGKEGDIPHTCDGWTWCKCNKVGCHTCVMIIIPMEECSRCDDCRQAGDNDFTHWISLWENRVVD